ncbi:YitT family protein [Chryseomicrobium palamuruense]|uniref:YitT family protein n=1 Tax=Chryseomicrobium palamuruense TaxID=682973 RepID=A0ABV8UTC6_9BACL
MRKTYAIRWAFYIVGLLLMALGISLTIKGQSLGISPWDVLHVSLFNLFGLTIGTWSILIGFLLILAVVIVEKRWPQIGTWLNIILIGSFIDFYNWILPTPESLIGQTFFFVLGVIVMGIGAGTYVAPRVGAGPRDSIMMMIVDRTGAKLKVVRTSMEILVALVGWLLGGPLGIGTVIIALMLGQLVHYTLPYVQSLIEKWSGEPFDVRAKPGHK